MCGAYGFSVKDAKDVYDRFEVVNQLEDLKPRWNVRPGQMNPVITSASPNNARAESVAHLPTYRVPFRNKRCIVPATGFYEPDKIHFTKSPFPWHYFQLKDQKVFGFAGLYDIWKDRQTGKEIYSYTIITTEPNTVVGEFHGRMPVILQKEDEETWLNPDITEQTELLPLLKPYPSIKMETWPVGDAARNVHNDYPEVMQPIEDTSQKPLL
jgi:putative SOS response-associated peptidase YedK